MDRVWVLQKTVRGTTYYLGIESGMWQWKKTESDALRLSRREDADKLAEIVEDADQVMDYLM